MGTQEILKDVVKETIVPLFKGEGYKKQGNNYAYLNPAFSAVVNIQSSKWNTQDEVEFCFNTGIYVEELFGIVYLYPKPSFPTVTSSVLQIRGTELTNNDNWYKLTPDSSVEELKRRITKDISEYILPHLQQFEKVKDVIRVMELREKAGTYENPHHLTALYRLTGDMEQAQARMTRVYNELQLESQKEFSAGLALRLGLEV
ncbi:hypothetical protein C173_32221 [Paenibacillus sp. FSL R7-277]|uniref:DUF4304 domain-containing protein n=1 Tax=Paenibacillus sp. FSL R7-277 TaxID=1227352 RepID=UPI0003E2B980|nr:DUF4304 domain-containing protein [Paenibacillus sp. FSL R7-277]ETT57071.1 hypothetical protein C173_32221 [Paenibacillus sp. FSL R7-277]